LPNTEKGNTIEAAQQVGQDGLDSLGSKGGFQGRQGFLGKKLVVFLFRGLRTFAVGAVFGGIRGKGAGGILEGGIPIA